MWQQRQAKPKQPIIRMGSSSYHVIDIFSNGWLYHHHPNQNRGYRQRATLPKSVPDRYNFSKVSSLKKSRFISSYHCQTLSCKRRVCVKCAESPFSYPFTSCHLITSHHIYLSLSPSPWFNITQSRNVLFVIRFSNFQKYSLSSSYPKVCNNEEIVRYVTFHYIVFIDCLIFYIYLPIRILLL